MPHSYSRLVLFFFSMVVSAQPDQQEWQRVLERLDRLEKENQVLIEQVHTLQETLLSQTKEAQTKEAQTKEAGQLQGPPIEEQVAVNQKRIEEQAQSKVDSSQRLPVTLSGTLLFNAFSNGRNSAGQQNPTRAALNAGIHERGATFDQTILGLQMRGPEIFGGGKLTGFIYMDFYNGLNQPLSNNLRLRLAAVQAVWKSRSLLVGQDKPIISPREPDSLAQVGESPLTGAGNLWLWQPQIRYEERLHFSGNTGLTARLGIYQTNEASTPVAEEDVKGRSNARPGWEGRFEGWHQFENGARIEIAPGFHLSRSLVSGQSIPSKIWSVDWLIRPAPQVDITGMYFTGKNVAGLGALHQGYTVLSNEGIAPVHSDGGWAQIAFLPTKRLSFHFYGGEQNDRASDLTAGGITRNLAFAANSMYRIWTNVSLGFEASQVRTSYLGHGTRLNNHYDLSVAYLF